MQDLLAAIEATALASHLRDSRWTYPAVNAAHVLGLALLVGAIVPLDLRLLGLWRAAPLDALAAVLRPMAATGAGLAVASGALLFMASARDYAAMPLFQLKMTILAVALANAALHAGDTLSTLPPERQRLAGALSLATWVAVLVCGRLIGYV